LIIFSHLGYGGGLILHQQNVPDHCESKLTQKGSYSSKSAYAAFFGIHQVWPVEKNLENLGSPHRRFFIWLVFRNRVWTADRLAKRNLPHPEAYPFCDQVEETINHLLLLVGCVFTRKV
jgi:hypothetical protein